MARDAVRDMAARADSAGVSGILPGLRADQDRAAEGDRADSVAEVQRSGRASAKGLLRAVHLGRGAHHPGTEQPRAGSAAPLTPRCVLLAREHEGRRNFAIHLTACSCERWRTQHSTITTYNSYWVLTDAHLAADPLRNVSDQHFMTASILSGACACALPPGSALRTSCQRRLL